MLQVRGMKKSYNENEVLKDINFELKKGEFLSVLGASGSGKSTLLRLLIGLERCEVGTWLIVNDIDITWKEPHERNMGIVFQNHSLFPNMTVLKNVMFGLRNIKVPKEEARQKALEILKKVRMEDRIDHYPHQLSGGEKQRVSIARTLVMGNDIVLFDEPLSALDAVLKESLQQEIKELQKELNLTIIYITHDQEEAFSMSDKIMIIKDGEIQQLASPKEIYNNPGNEYVKTFLVDTINSKIKRLQKNAGL